MVLQSILEAGGDVEVFRRRFARRLRWWLLGLPAGVGLATARAAAPVEATTAVDYHSTGHLLVIGPASIAIEAAGRAIGAGLAGAALAIELGIFQHNLTNAMGFINTS